MGEIMSYKNIAFYRKKAKMKQVDLAKKAEIARSYLSLIENGRLEITDEMYEKIASALEISVEELKAETETAEFLLVKKLIQMTENEIVEWKNKPFSILEYSSLNEIFLVVDIESDFDKNKIKNFYELTIENDLFDMFEYSDNIYLVHGILYGRENSKFKELKKCTLITTKKDTSILADLFELVASTNQNDVDIENMILRLENYQESKN